MKKSPGTVAPARMYPPGRILRQELDARGWSQKDLAEIICRPEQAISEIISAEKQITPDTALALSEALGTSAEFWINMEAAWQLFKARGRTSGNSTEEISPVARRARLFRLVPLRAILKRGWLGPARERRCDEIPIERLEQMVATILGIDDLEHPLPSTVAFRRALREDESEQATGALAAWRWRVLEVVGTRKVRPRTPENVERIAHSLEPLMAGLDSVVEVLPLMWAHGIPVVYLPQLPGTRLDGAAIRSGDRAIIGLTLRHDRLDAFWFTLLHELAHLALGHIGDHFDDLTEADTENTTGTALLRNRSRIEVAADMWAADRLIPSREWKRFIANERFTRERVTSFAASIGRHPAIVIGRLKYEGRVPWRTMRDLQVKVRGTLGDQIDE